MAQDRKSPRKHRDLGERAAALLESVAPGFQEMSPEEIRALVHDLQVHQIELERQNEELRQSQARLEESSKKYSDFYDLAPLGFLTLDKSGIVQEANLTLARQLGVARDRLINQPLGFFIHEADIDSFRLCLARLFQDLTEQHCEIGLKRKDGNVFFARLDIVAVQDAGGSQVCRISITDISELKQAERHLRESQDLFASFMAHLPSVTIIRDLEGRYLFVNAAWEQAFQKTRDEWLGKTTDDLWPPEIAAKFKAQDRRVLETGEALQTLGRLRHADGIHHWITYRFPIADQDGRTVMIGINAIDITEPMETKARLERLLSSSPAAIYTCEPRGDYALSYISENARTLVGWEPRQFLEDPHFWINHLHPEDRPRIRQRLELPWPRDHQSCEYRFLAKDGTYHWMHDEFRLVRDQNGHPVQISGVWMDITARKQMDQELHATSNRLRALIQASPLPIIPIDREGRITGWNPAAQRVFGWSESEVLDRPNPIIPPAQEEAFKELLARQMAGESFADLELMGWTKDGTLLDVRVFSAPIYDPQGEIVGVMAVIEDITASKRVRQALEESEAKFRATFHQAPIGAAIVSLDYRYQQVNAELCRLTGYTEAELASGTPLDITHPEDVASSMGRAARLAKGEIDHYQVDKRYVRKDGETVWVRLSVRLVRDAGGPPLYYLSMAEDITARRRAEEALKESENQYRLLVNQIPAIVFRGYGDWSVDFYDRKVEDLTGYRKEDFDARRIRWCDLIPAEDFNYAQGAFIEALKTNKSYVREHRIRRKDGEIRWVQCHGKIFCTAEGKVEYISGMSFDITAHKALEAQLMQAQKMEAVGRLAGGVAHDFNNLLMAIMGYGELMRTSLLKDDPLYQFIEDILKATERAASLTQQLLAFSRRQMMQPQVLSLNRVVSDLENMLQRLIGEHIDLKIAAAGDLGAVKADPGQIEQIIMNLSVNARDAMPTGGRLTLETANIDFAAGHNSHIEAIPHGGYVMLAVRDTGSGMDAETLAHIFEPFFTTKEMGKGTGLGLPMVYGIVKQNRGYVEVDSHPGQGTSFRIYLPRLEGPAEAPRARMTLAEKLEGSETILVVEDEEALRTLLCRFFRLYGYNVLEARHGGEALLICERHQGPIHLMVTDVVMPQMSGQELSDRLAPLHPEMKVFYISGYTDSDLSSYGLPDSAQTLIPKPFRPMDLVKMVREFLDSPEEVTNFSPPS